MKDGAGRPTTTRDLRTPERIFLEAIHRLGYGRFENLHIEDGELVLDPWPNTIRQVKFGSSDPGCEKEPRPEFKLKEQIAELFEYIRSVDTGEIRILEIRGGLPFAMQIVQQPDASGGVPSE
jgi:hypothetical protein